MTSLVKEKAFNNNFYFALFVDVVDFNFEGIVNAKKSYLPNMIVILNSGVVRCGKLGSDGLAFECCPSEVDDADFKW